MEATYPVVVFQALAPEIGARPMEDEGLRLTDLDETVFILMLT